MGEGFNFSWALDQLKQGKLLTRSGWNGKGMYVFLVEGSQFEVSRAPLDKIFPVGTPVTYRPHIDMKAADGTIGVWLASTSDILSDDWDIMVVPTQPEVIEEKTDEQVEDEINAKQADTNEQSSDAEAEEKVDIEGTDKDLEAMAQSDDESNAD